MPASPLDESLSYRDGTSQVGRASAWLDPTSTLVDERTLRDWLELAGQCARRLRYYDLSNLEAGNWLGLLAPGLNTVPGAPLSADEERALASALDRAVVFSESPEACAGPEFDFCRRPHFALLLTFLKLLRESQDRLNKFTQRHLEFHYRDVLRLLPRPATPNSVHVLVGLADDQDQFLVPAGTLLKAGSDARGVDLTYQTDSDLVANRTRVAQVKSLFVQKRFIGLAEVRQQPELLSVAPDEPNWRGFSRDNRRFVALMKLALGEPGPGGTLPRYPDVDWPGLPEHLLSELDQIVNFITGDLAMSVGTFRTLMELRHELDISRPEIQKKWAELNQVLAMAGARRWAPGAVGRFAVAEDFKTNHLVALKITEETFRGYPEVKSLYALYRHLDDTDRPVDPATGLTDLQSLVTATLQFESLDQFKQMMKFVVEEWQTGWRRVYDLLRTIARRKDSQKTPVFGDLRAHLPHRFNELVNTALGRPIFGAGVMHFEIGNYAIVELDHLEVALNRLEAYFGMSAEEYVYIREKCRAESVKSWEWEEVDAILRRAQVVKAIERRTALIAAERAQFADGEDALEAAARYALGRPGPRDPLPESRRFRSLTAEGDQNRDYIEKELYLDLASVQALQVVARNPAATPQDWAQVDRILERAQSRKEDWKEPIPQMEQWENLYAAEDATQVRPQLVEDVAESTPRWRTFGDGLRRDDATKPARLGFAVSSPLL
ncbi:MAG TPA: hypothetical protein PLX89_27040, partial [Verrucomicrobiota bacterium]|nr:hypothetical protein [Verrucomicrobiales bacterium]HRI16665.1 hypothetical protein [Verrucomicrobiota bacterium]